jgi:dTDP-glucose 4,6-dehydratase
MATKMIPALDSPGTGFIRLINSLKELIMKLLVTGGAGFIGSNFIHYIIREHSQWEITNLDKLTYAGNLENLQDIEQDPHYHFVKGDIGDRDLVDNLLRQSFDVIINFAAESHADRSILDCSEFLETNDKGAQILLEGARKYQVPRFLQISTDEVYGSINDGCFCEGNNICPTSPYAASKACADLLCLAYWKTHKVPVLITRCSNNYGPYQFPEKLIPLVITNAQENKPIPVYGDGLNVRDWIFVLDHCRAIDAVIRKGQPGEVYNVGASSEKTNLEIIYTILDLLHKPRSLIQFVTDRAAHDRRYAIDPTKLSNELGWKPDYSFQKSMADTVGWYLDHQDWWTRIKKGDYAQYYERMYRGR